MKLMVYVLLILLFTELSVSEVSLAQSSSSKECLKNVPQFLLTDWEKEVYAYYPKGFLSFIKCNEYFYDTLVGAIHEGVHQYDVEIKEFEKMMKIENQEKAHEEYTRLKKQMKLHFSNEHVLKMPQFESAFEKPLHLIPFFIEKTQLRLSQEFASFYEEYVLASDTLSSGSLFPGMVLEWSAYMQGLEASILRKDFILRPYVQGEGLLFFIAVVEIYLNQLEVHHPKDFESLKENKTAVEMISFLAKESVKAINKIDHCSEFKNEKSVLHTIRELELTNSLKKVLKSESGLIPLINSCK